MERACLKTFSRSQYCYAVLLASSGVWTAVCVIFRTQVSPLLSGDLNLLRRSVEPVFPVSRAADSHDSRCDRHVDAGSHGRPLRDHPLSSYRERRG